MDVARKVLECFIPLFVTIDPDGLAAIARVRQHAGHFVPAALLTGDIHVRPGAPQLADIHLLHNPVMPARLRAAIEAMAVERRSGPANSVAHTEGSTLPSLSTNPGRTH